MKKLLTFLTLLTLFFTTGWAAEQTITLKATTFGSPTSYQTKSATVGSYSFTVDQMMTSTAQASKGAIQMNSSKGSGTLYNTTAIPGLKSIKVNVASGNKTYTITTGNSQNPTTNEQTGTTGGTYNAQSGDTYFQLKVSGASYFSSIEITYDPDGGTTPEPTTFALTLPTGLTGGTVTATGYSDLTAIPAGTTMTVTATPATGYTLEWMKANGVDVTNPYEFIINAATTITASFTLESTQSGTEYTLVTNANDIVAGGEYLIVNSDKNALAGNAPTSANFFKSVTTGFTVNNNSIFTTGDSHEVFTLISATSGNGFYLKGKSLYYTLSKSSTNVTPSTTQNDASPIYIYLDNGFAYIGANNSEISSSNRKLAYNNQSPRFANYGSITVTGNQRPVYLYKKVEAAGAHTITLTQPAEGGTISASSSTADANATITVTATPAEGYQLNTVTVTPDGGTAFEATVVGNTATFTMPDADVTLTATFSKTWNAINTSILPTNCGGEIWVYSGTEMDGVKKAQLGDDIYFRVVTDQYNSYQLESLVIKDANNNTISYVDDPSDSGWKWQDGRYGAKYKFAMPGTAVTITATFKRGDLYLLGTANEVSTWTYTGPKLNYDGTKYSIDVYFKGADENDKFGYFSFTIQGNASSWGDISGKRLGAKDGNETVINSDYPEKNLGWNENAFKIPAGIYTIEVAADFSKVTITPKTVNLTFSPAAGSTQYVGTQVTVSSNLYSLLHAINSSLTESAVTNEVSLDGTAYSSSVALSTSATSVTGRATYGQIAATATASYTVNEIPAGSEYTLVTDASELGEGIEYVIMDKASGEGHAMSTTQNSNNRGQTELISIVNNKIIPTEDTQIITLEAATGGWYLNVGTGYLYAISSSNHLKTGTNLNSSDQYYVANITIGSENNVASIEFGTPTPRYIKHNSGSSIFSCYTSGQQEVYLFKKGVNNKSAAPVITPEGGNIVGYSQEVEITQANGGTIYYTTDGTTPTESSAQYTGKFWAEGENLGDEVTITAVAKEDGKELSNPVSVTYKFVAPVAPVFTPAGGTYTTAQEVSISSTTEGADVYYTTTAGLSAAQIVAQGTKFTTAINVSEETTYYAVTVYHDAHANRDALSSVRQAQYKFSEVESEGLPYTHPFTGGTGFGKFTTEEGDPDITVWTVTDEFGARGSSYINGTNYTVGDSWLISPYINLTDAVEPVLTFKHSISKYFIVPNEQATVWIRTYGGEWTPLTTNLPANSNGLSGYTHYSEEYDLSAYNNQLIQVGFKYVNPYQNRGGGIWEIQDFSVVDMNQPIIEVNNIAEFMDNEKVPADRKAKILNPVVVLYHYQQYHNDEEGDYVNDYIWVKDESGYAIIYGKYLDVNYTNGDVIPGGFTATKFYYNVGRFYQMYYPEGLQPATEKALADPEAVTLSLLNGNKDNYNGHYVTIPKMRIKFSSGKLVPYEYNFTTEESYGGQRNFEIGDATLSISNNNKSIIGYNNFDNPWLETLAYPEYENTTSDYGDYNITGIFERYNGVWEFMPIIITPWEENKVTLHDLCQDGVTDEGQNNYTISNNLLGVYSYYDETLDADILWVKDDNGQSIHMVSPVAPYTENFAIEFEDLKDGNGNVVIPANTRLEQQYYDQSNWCQLILTGKNGKDFEGKIINGGAIEGRFTDKLNPTMTGVTLTQDDIYSNGSYAPNYYIPASFVGSQSCNTDMYGQDGHGDFFFMTPKPQEYATVVWAVWDGQKMNMPTKQQGNSHELSGEFSIDLSMNQFGTSAIPAGVYSFHAIIRKVNTSGAPALKGKGGIQNDQSANYMVYPLDIDPDNNPSTAINTVDVNGKAVKSVKFYNVAGIESATPFQGINIVVTEYTDGSRTTTKMLCR